MGNNTGENGVLKCTLQHGFTCNKVMPPGPKKSCYNGGAVFLKGQLNVQKVFLNCFEEYFFHFYTFFGIPHTRNKFTMSSWYLNTCNNIIRYAFYWVLMTIPVLASMSTCTSPGVLWVLNVIARNGFFFNKPPWPCKSGLHKPCNTCLALCALICLELSISHM